SPAIRQAAAPGRRAQRCHRQPRNLGRESGAQRRPRRAPRARPRRPRPPLRRTTRDYRAGVLLRHDPDGDRRAPQSAARDGQDVHSPGDDEAPRCAQAGYGAAAMNHSVAEDKMKDRALLYALGTLTLAEARAFEDHIAGGCEECAVEMTAAEQIAANLS